VRRLALVGLLAVACGGDKDDGSKTAARELPPFQPAGTTADAAPPPRNPPASSVGADAGPSVEAKPEVTRPEGKDGDAAAAKRKAEEEMQRELEKQAMAYADMLTGEGPQGTAQMDQRAPGTDLKEQAEDVHESGRKVEVDSGGRKDPSPPPPAPVHISVSAKTDIDSFAAVVERKVKAAYLAGIKKCVDDVGTVKLKLIVDQRGRATRVAVLGASSEADDCLLQKAMNWRFTPYKDEDGESESVQTVVTLVVTR